MGLLEKLKAGETIIIAEGYLFDFERRGYLKAGAFVPEVVIEHPDLVRNLHREYVHAGSDVVLALTHYAHREKMRIIGRENDLEKINRDALRIAREVADETGTMMAGNTCNTNIFVPEDPESHKAVYAIFQEQVKWAAEGGADFIVAETLYHIGEALLALKAINEAGLPAVIMLGPWRDGVVDEDIDLAEACKRLEDAGADVVGLNCGRGPATMLPLMKKIRKVCKGPIAALPVPYRTTPEHNCFLVLKCIDDPDKNAFPTNLDPHLCSRDQIADFAREAQKIGIQFMGLCCGNSSHYLRSLAEALGRTPPSSRYSADMSKHFCSQQADNYRPAVSVFKTAT